MDAVKFIEERNRMCKSFGDRCTECPAFNVCEDELRCGVGTQSTLDATAQVAMVEKWSAAHPRKTRQSVFLKQWPDAVLDRSGVMLLCPTNVSTAHRGNNGKCKNPEKLCTDCRREFWMQEVE